MGIMMVETPGIQHFRSDRNPQNSAFQEWGVDLTLVQIGSNGKKTRVVFQPRGPALTRVFHTHKLSRRYWARPTRLAQKSSFHSNNTVNNITFQSKWTLIILILYMIYDWFLSYIRYTKTIFYENMLFSLTYMLFLWLIFYENILSETDYKGELTRRFRVSDKDF